MGQKGRNSRLMKKRDALVASRYYYWTEVQRLRFDDAIKQLSENEFFLSESRIIQILKKADNVEKVKLKTPGCPKLTAEQIELFKGTEK